MSNSRVAIRFIDQLKTLFLAVVLVNTEWPMKGIILLNRKNLSVLKKKTYRKTKFFYLRINFYISSTTVLDITAASYVGTSDKAEE